MVFLPSAKDKLFLASTITIILCVFLLEILASRPNQTLPAKSMLDAFYKTVEKVGFIQKKRTEVKL